VDITEAFGQRKVLFPTLREENAGGTSMIDVAAVGRIVVGPAYALVHFGIALTKPDVRASAYRTFRAFSARILLLGTSCWSQPTSFALSHCKTMTMLAAAGRYRSRLPPRCPSS
jgi:hypothetical protein